MKWFLKKIPSIFCNETKKQPYPPPENDEQKNQISMLT